MEHNDAVRLQAVEKYILGELSPAVRDEFETHYFDCAVCSFNLRAGVAFAAGTRQLFAEAPARVRREHSAGWFSWLRPMIAVPVMAVLLFVIGYQYVSSRSSSEVEAWYSLSDSSVHGSSGTRIEARRGQGFHILFDVLPAPQNPNATLLVEVQDVAGRTVLRKSVSALLAQKSLILDLPADFKEGEYKVVVFDLASGSPVRLEQLTFTVAFSS
ncbi:MAG: zf-HC2 domain-containing protein [Acidobacteria bacterium]|nr:zf-HC2 domain-containing protein [Acidobacteriota bacterium]MBS1865949.1 zf-HC2 domain-containing protein [Acidobacteriota bacterium]